MRKFVPGALAGLVVAAVLAAPVHAAMVSVRIEGAAQTLLPRTTVNTTGAPVGKPGQPTCDGASALAAVDLATGGNWDGPYDSGFATYSLATLKGETHDAATMAYWAFWINDTYASLGVCGQQVQQGDSLLFVPECYAAGCSATSPLRLTGVPATAKPGQAVTVKVEQLSAPVFPATETTSAPAAGATVVFGGVVATTGADGTATVTVAGSGPEAVQATKSGHVRSPTESSCITTGSDGACGSSAPGSPGAGTTAGKDTTAPTATIAGLKKTYARGRGPRELSGTVAETGSGIRSVRIAITRRKGGRCTAFNGTRERFKGHRCGGWKSFRIGDRADWSYLLPQRLGPGRYTIRVIAIDKAGNDGATTQKLRVR